MRATAGLSGICYSCAEFCWQCGAHTAGCAISCTVRGLRLRGRPYTGQFTFPDRVPLSAEVKDLLAKMIHVDPLRRANMADIQVCRGKALS